MRCVLCATRTCDARALPLNKKMLSRKRSAADLAAVYVESDGHVHLPRLQATWGWRRKVRGQERSKSIGTVGGGLTIGSTFDVAAGSSTSSCIRSVKSVACTLASHRVILAIAPSYRVSCIDFIPSCEAKGVTMGIRAWPFQAMGRTSTNEPTCYSDAGDAGFPYGKAAEPALPPDVRFPEGDQPE
jgi:hypothetical protein